MGTHIIETYVIPLIITIVCSFLIASALPLFAPDHQPTRPSMTESAFNRVSTDDFGTFTFTTKRSYDAFVRRCQKYNVDPVDTAEYTDKNGNFDTAIIRIHKDDLRPLRLLVKP